MNRKFTSVSLVAGSIFAVVIIATQVLPAQQDALCSEQQFAHMDTSKPLSHPDNYCAAQQQADLSWTSWLSGRSKSNQFHYLDLLELLSRFSDEPSQSYPGAAN